MDAVNIRTRKIKYLIFNTYSVRNLGLYGTRLISVKFRYGRCWNYTNQCIWSCNIVVETMVAVWNGGISNGF